MIVVGKSIFGEIVLRVQPVVVTEIEGVAVEIVGTALERHIDGGATLDPVLSRWKLLHSVLRDGIVAQNGSWNA